MSRPDEHAVYSTQGAFSYHHPPSTTYQAPHHASPSVPHELPTLNASRFSMAHIPELNRIMLQRKNEFVHLATSDDTPLPYLDPLNPDEYFPLSSWAQSLLVKHLIRTLELQTHERHEPAYIQEYNNLQRSIHGTIMFSIGNGPFNMFGVTVTPKKFNCISINVRWLNKHKGRVFMVKAIPWTSLCIRRTIVSICDQIVDIFSLRRLDIAYQQQAGGHIYPLHLPLRTFIPRHNDAQIAALVSAQHTPRYMISSHHGAPSSRPTTTTTTTTSSSSSSFSSGAAANTVCCAADTDMTLCENVEPSHKPILPLSSPPRSSVVSVSPASQLASPISNTVASLAAATDAVTPALSTAMAAAVVVEAPEEAAALPVAVAAAAATDAVAPTASTAAAAAAAPAPEAPKEAAALPADAADAADAAASIEAVLVVTAPTDDTEPTRPVVVETTADEACFSPVANSRGIVDTSDPHAAVDAITTAIANTITHATDITRVATVTSIDTQSIIEAISRELVSIRIELAQLNAYHAQQDMLTTTRRRSRSTGGRRQKRRNRSSSTSSSDSSQSTRSGETRRYETRKDEKMDIPTKRTKYSRE